MKPKNSVAKLLCCLTFCLLLSGCYANYDAESENMSNTRQFGETVEVDYSFSMFDLYKRGPYRLSITPEGIAQLSIGGSTKNCLKVRYVVLSTNDGEPASYADCTVAVDILKENLTTCNYSAWYVDDQGTQADTYGSIDINDPQTFYVPIDEELENIEYITVSDRSDYYLRSGVTYWYRFDGNTLPDSVA